MKKVYDLHRHTDCAVIHFGKSKVYVKMISTSNRSLLLLENALSEEACITYNKQQTKVLLWGNTSLKADSNQDHTYIDNFMDGLRQLFKKEQSDWNKDDVFFVQAVSDYLSLAVKKSMLQSEKKIESMGMIHYAFVVPSEWPEEIRQELIQPIFIKAGLISNKDHKDRLLFFSDIESICYSLQNSADGEGKNDWFRRGQNTVLARLAAVKDDGVRIKLDLIYTMNTLFDFPHSVLFPKVMRSQSLLVTSKDIKKCIETFIYSKLSLEDQSQIVEMMVEEIYSKNFTDTNSNRNYDRLMDPFITEKKYWQLNQLHTTFLKSIRIYDICVEIGKTLLDNLKDLLSSNFLKEYSIVILQDYYTSEVEFDPSLVEWLKYTLEYNRRFLKLITTTKKATTNTKVVRRKNILQGAGLGVLETIQNADMYIKPRMLSKGYSPGSSSLFLNSRPNVIININISLKSTLLSYSLLDENGIIKETISHSSFTIDKCLPSLRNFFKVSSITTVYTKKRFIMFAEKYLMDYYNHLNIDKNFMLEIEAILNNTITSGKRRSHIKASLLKYKAYVKKSIFHTDDTYEEALVSSAEDSVSTEQKKYIKAFVLMYMIYIKHLISNKLSTNAHTEKSHIKIGYMVSIEKMLLDHVIGNNKRDFQGLVLESGLVPKDDPSKKLRVVTQGEVLLPAIQRLSVQLKFPLKSYFVLAQLHEDYVQLTLNQVVTSPCSEQESIILQDNIIRIPNMYDSLCFLMWNKLTQNTCLIQLCNVHKSDGTELFSLKTKSEFMIHLKEYISNNILAENSNLQSITDLRLNKTCHCQVDLKFQDILNICFKPFLQQISVTVQSSLINQQLFAKYANIKYLFILIYFNKNVQFQHAIVKILIEEAEDFNREQGIETACVVIPELPTQLFQLQPVIYHKAFSGGMLHQVFSENYGFTIYQREGSRQFVYKNNRTDTNLIEIDSNTAFPLFKKGDIINPDSLNKVFYLNLQHDLGGTYIYIGKKEKKKKSHINSSYNLLFFIQNFIDLKVLICLRIMIRFL
ncbi:hypothetical protein BDF21DRAFT_413720 [Thamnidium elegans]|nr:hypothetical protein BDF21DRAFT_413720 [Thamnidium elegans]